MMRGALAQTSLLFCAAAPEEFNSTWNGKE